MTRNFTGRLLGILAGLIFCCAALTAVAHKGVLNATESAGSAACAPAAALPADSCPANTVDCGTDMCCPSETPLCCAGGKQGCCPSGKPWACPSNHKCYETEEEVQANCGGTIAYCK